MKNYLERYIVLWPAATASQCARRRQKQKSWTAASRTPIIALAPHGAQRVHFENSFSGVGSMSYFFVVPTDENGLILDQGITRDLRTALSAPFDYQDVYVYAHGWWTSPQRAMQDYNQFTIEFARTCLSRLAAAAAGGASPTALGIGVQWPSMIGQSPSELANAIEAFTFYQMETRANAIGANAGYALVRSIIQEAPPRRKLNFIGHSFGCKVVCSLLTELVRDRATVQLPAETEVNVILLQAAFDNNDLEPDNIYGNLAAGIPNARLLVTVSRLDEALGTFFPAAEKLNFFHTLGESRVALGYGGPTDEVFESFGMATPIVPIKVGAGFDGAGVPPRGGPRLVVADLTPLHADPSSAAFNAPLVGHHSDIFREEIYALIAGFV